MRGLYRPAIGRPDRPLVGVALNSKEGIGIDHAGHLLIVKLAYWFPVQTYRFAARSSKPARLTGRVQAQPSCATKMWSNEAIHDICPAGHGQP